MKRNGSWFELQATFNKQSRFEESSYFLLFHYCCSPECAGALEDARRLTVLTKEVMLQLQKAISEAQDTRNTVHEAVENRLQGKMEETLSHKVMGDSLL